MMKTLTSIVTVVAFLLATLSIAASNGDSGDKNARSETSISTVQIVKADMSGLQDCCDAGDTQTHSDSSHCGAMCHLFGVATSSTQYLLAREVFSPPLDQAAGHLMGPTRRPPKIIL